MRSSPSPTRSLRSVLALCALSLVATACAPDLAPGVPADFQRRGAPGGGPGVLAAAQDSCGNNTHPPDLDASVVVDAQVFDDAFVDDAGLNSDGSLGCAISQCMPTSFCCPFDGRCYPVGCVSCCALFPDGGPAL